MSKSANFPYELIIDGKSIISDKDSDGKMRSIELMMDPDYNKEAIEILESCDSCFMLKYDDRWNNYFWNCCAGSYFCDDSYL